MCEKRHRAHAGGDRGHGDGEIGGAVWKNRLTYAQCAASA